MIGGTASLDLLYGAALPPSVADFAESQGFTTTQVVVGESPSDEAGDGIHISAVSPRGDGNVFVASDVTEYGLDLVMIPTVCACVESTQTFCGFNDDVVARIRSSDVYLSLTTASAYKSEVALHFYRWIASIIELNDTMKMNLELALQEALANGLIHGNMGLNKTLPDSFHDLESYAGTVQDKLESEGAGQKRIEVWAKWDDTELSVSILDHGAGFDIEAPVEKSVTGWGLGLIESLTSGIAITEGGRKMTMRFER